MDSNLDHQGPSVNQDSSVIAVGTIKVPGLNYNLMRLTGCGPGRVQQIPNRKFIGFWAQRPGLTKGELMREAPWSTPFTEYPDPDSQTEDLSEILAKLSKIQQKAGARCYLGFSNCRLCGESNGTMDYYLDEFVWPEGYLHYLQNHLVDIDPEFKYWIENFDFDQEHILDDNYKY